MTILLSLFFISMLGLLCMMGMKLAAVRSNGGFIEKEELEILSPYIEELKLAGKRRIKRYGYMALVGAIRLYFRSFNLIKANYLGLVSKIKDLHVKHLPVKIETEEMNKFLKVISDYKQKIKKIKHKIKEEENSR